MTTLNINQLSLSAKRALLTELKESIKQSVAIQKNNRVLIKQNKENEKKAKVLAAIKAAEEKLAKLQAKLA
jgi:lipoprotein NlpI